MGRMIYLERRKTSGNVWLGIATVIVGLVVFVEISGALGGAEESRPADSPYDSSWVSSSGTSDIIAQKGELWNPYIVDIAVDSRGKGHVVYYNFVRWQDYIYSHQQVAGDWGRDSLSGEPLGLLAESHQPLPGGEHLFLPAVVIELDGQDTPHIVSGDQRGLYYTTWRRDKTGWTRFQSRIPQEKEYSEEDCSVGYGAQRLVVSPDGKSPYVLVRDWDDKSLKLAYMKDGVWTVEAVGHHVAQRRLWDHRLAISKENMPIVAYRNLLSTEKFSADEYRIGVATRSTEGWSDEEVVKLEHGTHSPWLIGLLHDERGLLHVLWHDDRTNMLQEYVRTEGKWKKLDGMPVAGRVKRRTVSTTVAQDGTFFVLFNRDDQSVNVKAGLYLWEKRDNKWREYFLEDYGKVFGTAIASGESSQLHIAALHSFVHKGEIIKQGFVSLHEFKLERSRRPVGTEVPRSPNPRPVSEGQEDSVRHSELHQVEGKVPVKEFTNSIGMKLILIPAGEFMMGSSKSEKDRDPSEGPQQHIKITKPFYMGVYEVTVAEFRQFVEATGYRTEAESGEGPLVRLKEGLGRTTKHDASWKNPYFRQGGTNPVGCITWNDAARFCEWLGEKDGKTYRLPTEAEWEYACRAGTTTAFHYGDSLSSRQANFNGNYPYGRASKGRNLVKTTPVGSYSSNAWGLYDMHGNVSEWCSDWNPEKFYGRIPGDVLSKMRMTRGGQYDYIGQDCRSAFRGLEDPVPIITPGHGFRVVREVKP